MEQTTAPTSSCCSSCWESCRLKAMASAANCVKSLVLLFLEQKEPRVSESNDCPPRQSTSTSRFVFVEMPVIPLQSMGGWKTSGWSVLHRRGKTCRTLRRTQTSACVTGDTHPLHPRVLEDLGGAEAQSGISHQQLGDEVLGSVCDVSPVPVSKLVLALLDALEQVTLKRQRAQDEVHWCRRLKVHRQLLRQWRVPGTFCRSPPCPSHSQSHSDQ